ncbi:MAG: FimV/HubP family polar landmark protein [Marinobacter sp.]|uniref:FimV/HubP family polar landmark protein n=1 Tax=Marinobacter sp. TaxID=50741 RepID=UPI003C485ADF
MKVRKLAVALALAGGLGSGVAQALGLGEIELQSYLNEPLDADINLRKSQGVDPGDVFVNIASENDYQRVGIDRNTFLTKLQFEVTTSRDGGLIVNVTSREPLREPYLNFLLEVTWPSGRLMREYSVLVDPPVYAEESGIDERVSAPATRSETSTTQRQELFGASGRDGDTRTSSGSGARTFGPTNSADTLWKIAANVRPDDSVSMQQAMLAIQDLNPDAFMDGNINRLKRGEVLRLPDMDQMRSRSVVEANRLVAAQNEAFSSPRPAVDATESASAPAETASQGTSGDELRLIAEDDSGARSAEEGGSAGGDGQTAGGVDAGSAVALEELESARRENDELNSRVDDLQDQVETLQRLLELKDSQLAEMQQMSADETSETGTPIEGEESPEVATTADEAAEEDDQASRGDGDAAAPEADASPDESGQDGAMVGDEQPGADDAMADSAGNETDAEDQPVADDGSESAIEAEGTPAADDIEAPEPAAEAEPAAEPEAAEQPAVPAQQQEKGFPGNIIDAITGNPMYQLALGGGLVILLLLLLLLARRNANREKAFYEQLNGEGDDSTDSFDLTLDDEDTVDASVDEPMAEAETYIAYGQMDKAAETLETAISREPSRTDLRLKLLGVYADTQDRESFEKQFREIGALNDEQATDEASALRDRLEEAEAMPSIDDLESQLRSDSFARDDEPSSGAPVEQESHLTDETLSDQFETRAEETSAEEFGELDTDFSDLELSDEALEDTKAGEESADSDMIEYDLSSLETGTENETVADDALTTDEARIASDEVAESTGEAVDEDDISFDFDSSDFDAKPELASSDAYENSGELDLDEFQSLETEADPTSGRGVEESDGKMTPVEEAVEAGEDPGDLDESFLDELDAELDKVSDDEGESYSSEESSLDDLELDVSDEDLALMEEFADSGDSANPETSESEVSLDEELDLEDNLVDKSSESPEELSAEAENLEGVEGLDEELSDLEIDGPEAGEDLEPPLASDALDKSARRSAVDDIDESELGDDDDFDFLAGTDEAATKLDLARAYIEMGDVDGARDILEEVALEGNDEQKTEAQDLLKNLS